MLAVRWQVGPAALSVVCYLLSFFVVCSLRAVNSLWFVDCAGCLLCHVFGVCRLFWIASCCVVCGRFLRCLLFVVCGCVVCRLLCALIFLVVIRFVCCVRVCVRSVMFAVCCLLCVDCCMSFALCGMLLVHGSSCLWSAVFASCRMPFAECCMLFVDWLVVVMLVERCLLLVACLFVVSCTLFDVCWVWCAVC